MERDKEIAKLVNVLRRTARMAMQTEWTGGAQDAAAFCVDQYNRVLARLKELDPDMAAVFEPLPPGSSLSVAAMACRQLAAYYEDEVWSSYGWRSWIDGIPRRGKSADSRGCGAAFDAKSFKDFWAKSAREIEDLGEFIRQSVEEWARTRKPEKDEPKTSDE
jgi:hypothetical protein